MGSISQRRKKPESKRMERIKQFLQKYYRGGDPIQIAEEAKVTLRTVYRWINDYGYGVEVKSRHVTRTYNKWVFQYESGQYYKWVGANSYRDLVHKTKSILEANRFNSPDDQVKDKGTWRKIKTTITVELEGD